jgi:hypothetical protein
MQSLIITASGWQPALRGLSLMPVSGHVFMRAETSFQLARLSALIG